MMQLICIQILYKINIVLQIVKYMYTKEVMMC